MVYVLEDTSKVERLFDGWQETLIYSCLQKVMGKVFVTDLENPVTADFVSAFESKEKHLEDGRGVVILKDDKFVSGASSYTRYKEGIEIEVDTIESERRKHLAEKLGYEFDHEYIAYEVSSNMRTH